MAAQPTIGQRLIKLRNSARGRAVLQATAVVSLLYVLAPQFGALIVGVSTDWFQDPPSSDVASKVVNLIDSVSQSKAQVLGTLVAAFPALAFCLAYAGRREGSLTRFGTSILAMLLIGSITGTALGVYVNPSDALLPCENSEACTTWLASACIDSARQCLTYFSLLLGFDWLSEQSNAKQ